MCVCACACVRVRRQSEPGHVGDVGQHDERVHELRVSARQLLPVGELVGRAVRQRVLLPEPAAGERDGVSGGHVVRRDGPVAVRVVRGGDVQRVGGPDVERDMRGVHGGLRVRQCGDERGAERVVRAGLHVPDGDVERDGLSVPCRILLPEPGHVRDDAAECDDQRDDERDGSGPECDRRLQCH
jgi:hypothetical protein